MNLQEEAEMYRNDLRQTIPRAVRHVTRGWGGYGGLGPIERVGQYMADISERIFPSKEREQFQNFLDGQTSKVGERTLSVLLATFNISIEKFLPSVQVKERETPVGAEAFMHMPDYFRALDLVSSK